MVYPIFGNTARCEMSQVVQELRERKAKLIEELDMIDQYLKLHQKLFPSAAPANKSGPETPDDAKETDAAKNDPREVAARVVAILREHGKPIQRGELVRKIEESGLPIHSKDKNKYLGTVLWRNRDTFVNIEGHGYWIKGMNVDVPPAGLSLDLLD